MIHGIMAFMKYAYSPSKATLPGFWSLAPSSWVYHPAKYLLPEEPFVWETAAITGL
jgi:hypothetical protein